MDDDPKLDELKRTFSDPLSLSNAQWQTIRKIARVIMDERRCDYTKAVVIAYIEVFEMAEMEKTEH